MKIDEAKCLAQKCINRLNSITNIYEDDGVDNCDYGQNLNFCSNLELINDIQSTLAGIEIDGMDSAMLDKAWLDCAGDNFHGNLPECKYNRAINYANYIINLSLDINSILYI